MRALSTPELLEVWERGLGLSPLERALLLLAAATGATPASLAHLSLGQRDAWLLRLRESAFGSELIGLAQCPACGERLEMTFNLADLRVDCEPFKKESDAQGIVSPGSPSPQTGVTETFTLAVKGYDIACRLPNSLDLLSLAHCLNEERARHTLLARCLLRATRDGEEISGEELPEDVWRAVEERMAETDAQADVRLALSCTRCAGKWEEIFDINSFFWTEINAWAMRLLGEVHTLARAYGWRERDILEMGARRREFYLNAVAG